MLTRAAKSRIFLPFPCTAQKGSSLFSFSCGTIFHPLCLLFCYVPQADEPKVRSGSRLDGPAAGVSFDIGEFFSLRALVWGFFSPYSGPSPSFPLLTRLFMNHLSDSLFAARRTVKPSRTILCRVFSPLLRRKLRSDQKIDTTPNTACTPT